MYIKRQTNNNDNYYGTLVEKCFSAISKWADVTGYQGKVEFFFENGAEGVGITNEFFANLRKDPANPSFSKYGGHWIIPKKDNAGIQAADFLAWQYHNYTKKRNSDDLPRLDTRALMRHPHLILDECGKPPSKNSIQTIEDSRIYKEIVYYMPKATKSQVEFGTVLIPASDFVIFKGNVKRKTVLACSSCFRALTENVDISQMKNIFIKCFCGQHSFLSGQLDIRQLRHP